VTQLSSDARAVLRDGLAADGPGRERQARVKARLLAALGSGTLTLGSAASAAGTAAPGLAVGSLGLAKGLGVGTLLLWFGAGAALGVGASGAIAVATHQAPEAVRSASFVEPTPAPLAVAAAAVPAPSVRAELSAEPGVRDDAVSVSATAPEPNRAPSADARTPARASEGSVAEPLSSAAPPAGHGSTLSEEAALLERAQRALSAKNPGLALMILDEHERRFAAGALREEREAARVLALCGLGRVNEARARARAFMNAAPRSVLVPRLEHSCAAPVQATAK
jgi:hypothetical protein